MMKEDHLIDFKIVAQQMRGQLTHIAMWRKIVRLLIYSVYPLALLWLAFTIFGRYIVEAGNYETSQITATYVVIFFVAFVVLNTLFSLCLNVLKQKEEKVMGQIINQLFPDANYSPTKEVKVSDIRASRLFGPPNRSEGILQVASYGALSFPTQHQALTIADIGVTATNEQNTKPWRSFRLLCRAIFSPMWGAQVESTMFSFRGMFGYCCLPRTCRGFVMLLPDHLEDKLGYFALTIQKLRERHKAKFVYLEDPEFERLFTVYADDEVEARMILTPAMMKKLTALRCSFTHDLMLSFSGDTFYYASNMPKGFLRLSGKTSLNEDLLLEIYQEIGFCLSVEEMMGKHVDK